MRISTNRSWLLSVVCVWLSAVQVYAQITPPFAYTSNPRDTLGRLREDEERRTIDPTLGRVPHERLAEAREKLFKTQRNGVTNESIVIPGMVWRERGPADVGGRTRALLFDPNDPAKKKVWAGSPFGGLWYTADITNPAATWTPVSDQWENRVVTALAADPSNPQVMYAATGDRYNYVDGGGLWKTTDGGTTWNRLSSTIPSGNYPSTGQSFLYVQRITVNSSGQVFAAGRYGLVRSVDGGATWQTVLAPNQGIGGTNTGLYWYDLVTDLKMGADGILYAAFWPSRVFKSKNALGGTWEEITPTDVPNGGERTELALAPSTSGAGQVVYAVARSYNSTSYNNDIRWFRKSASAGSTWTSMTIPTHSWGDHFTIGSGYYTMGITAHPTDPNTVYAGGYGLFRSTDGGTNWSGQLTYSPEYQQGIWFQPGTTAAACATEAGVRWLPNWGVNTVAVPTLVDRNTGYRVANAQGASMKPVAGGSYLLVSPAQYSPTVIRYPGLDNGSAIFSGAQNNQHSTFIDENEPNLQLFSYYGSWYRYDGNAATYLLGPSYGYYSGTPSAYDSQLNRIYTVEYDPNYGGTVIRRISGVSVNTTPSSSYFTIPGVPTAMRLSSNGNSLIVAYDGSIVRYTNLSSAVPTATTIPTSSLPTYTTISGIDIGSTENDLLVTLSNYGVSSVWFTNNSGASWDNKDLGSSGLPDVPVRSGAFNPNNRQQVVLATDLGVWTTNNFFDVNPGWGASNTGLPIMRVNQVRFRAADSRLIALTAGRGVFETTTLETPYTPSSIALTNVSSVSLCPGSVFNVAFTVSGPAHTSSTTYEAWLSDANGTFSTQRRIGVGTGSSNALTATLPMDYNALPYGTNYRIRVVAPDLDVSSANSVALTLNSLQKARITDRTDTFWYTGGAASLCPNDQVRLTASPVDYNNKPVPADSYQWLLDGQAISGATSSTYLAARAGTYTARTQWANCSVTGYSYYVYKGSTINNGITSPFGSQPQCDDNPALLVATYPGELTPIQWTRNGAAISGATSSTYLATQSGTYGISLDSSACSRISNGTLNVMLSRSLLARLYTSAGDTVLCNGSSTGNVYMYTSYVPSYTALSGSLPTVRWYRDNVPINQYTNQAYFYAYQPGRYTYELQQGTCRTRSNAVVVTQQAAILVPTVASTGNIRSACPGTSIYLSLSTGWGAYWSLQWQKDGVDISGATNINYVASSSGSYSVRVTKGSCSVVSEPLSLTFSNTWSPVLMPVEPVEQCSSIWLNTNVVFPTGGLQVQWFKDGTAIAGATNNSYLAAQAGAYSFSVTNGSCAGLSKAVYVKPYSLSKPLISPMGDVNVCQNNVVQLIANNYGGGKLQWKRDGVAIPFETSYNAYVTQSGRYSLELINACGVAESEPLAVQIGEPAAGTLTGTALVSAGQAVLLPVQFSGPAPWSFTLSNGQSVANTYMNPHMVSLTATASASYALAAMHNACGTGTAVGQATVTVGSGSADLSLSAQVSSRTPRVGEVVSYSLTLTNESSQAANGVRVSSRLPAGLEFVDASSPGISVADGLVSADVGTVSASSSVVLSYNLRVTQPGTYLASAQIVALTTPDPDSQPDSGTGDGQDDVAVVDLRTIDAVGGLSQSPNPNQTYLPPVRSNQPPTQAGKVELSLDLRSEVASTNANEPVSLSLIVGNRGAVTATNLMVQILLPASWKLVDNTGYNVSGQVVTAYLTPLSAGRQVVLRLPIRGITSGSVQAQVLRVDEPVANATPGNGYQNGERDEAAVMIRVR